MRLSRHELLGLWNTAEGNRVPRPLLRRLIRLGLTEYIPNVDAPQLTDAGVKLLEELAPRSKWTPPRQQGLVESSRRQSLMAVSAIGIIGSLGRR